MLSQLIKPSHRMGVHWIPIHGRKEDETFIQELKPFCVKIINPDPNKALWVLQHSQYVWLRDHPLSEQKGDMFSSPIATGVRHADEWHQKLNTRFSNLPRDRVIVSGINEPYVHNETEETIVFAYTKAFLNRLTEYNIKGSALNLSVGWPRNLGTDKPPYWKTFLPLEDIINKGNHFLCTHEYWYSDPDDNWYEPGKHGWLSYRINACPMAVPVIIGECGLERRVDTERMKREGKPPGWFGTMSSSQYADQLWRYAGERLNPNVVCVLPFTTDWGSHDWDTQDTKEAHTEILRQKKTYFFPSIWPVHPGNKGKNVFEFPISQYFADTRYGRLHEGLDLVCPLDTEIGALEDGTVMWVGTDINYGNYVRLYHEKLNLGTFYAHLNKSFVIQGQTVTKGQIIGLSGSTGNSTGPHVHLEVRLHKAKNEYTKTILGNGRTDPLFLKHII